MVQKEPVIQLVPLTSVLITPALIQSVLAHYKLSQNEMDLRMGYAKRAHATSHVLHNPEAYLKPRFISRFRFALAHLQRERGFAREIVLLNGLVDLPQSFRVYKLPPLCKGHGEYVFGLPRAGFCNKECRELYTVARKRKRSKR